MELCKTDILNIVRYLNDAATLYDAQGYKSTYSNRARLLRNLSKKITRKFNDEQAIQLDRNATAALSIPPVVGCRKHWDGSLTYQLDGINLPNIANEGDWLIQDDGEWYHLTDEERENKLDYKY